MDSPKIQLKISQLSKSQKYLAKGPFNNNIVKILNDEMSRKRRVLDKKIQRKFLAKKRMEPKPHILDENKAKWTEFLVS